MGTINPSRLTIARQRRGLTRTALAARLGLDRTSVHFYEHGVKSPSPATLGRLSTVLGFPVSFFFGEDIDAPSAGSGSFRSMSRMRASARDMALAQVAFGAQLSDWLARKFALPPPEIPDFSFGCDPEGAASMLRQEWSLGVLAIRNMVHLLESKGVRVLSLAVDSAAVDAFSMWREEVPFVFLNTLKTAERSRFDAAHELGHLVLHRHGWPNGVGAERQANAFASAFLMPRASVMARVRHLPSFSSLVSLKAVWGVSVAALAYRLRQLNLLSEWQHRAICVRLAREGKQNEPEPMPRECSLVLPQALGALSREGMSRAAVAREVGLPPGELESLLGGLALSAVEGGGGPSRRPRPRLKLVEE